MSDLINRHDVLNAIKDCGICTQKILDLPSEKPYTDEEIQRMSELEQAEIDKAYELGRESMRETGHWILLETMKYDLVYGPRIYIPQAKCSCCRHIYKGYVRWDEPIMPEDADLPRYCECCGTRMEGVKA